MRAVIYARVSVAKNGQAESDSIVNQVTHLTQLAAAKGLNLGLVYTDDGISGYAKKSREGFDALLADMNDNQFDMILIRHHDRFERNAGDFDVLKVGAVKNGVKWMDGAGTITDPSTSGGTLTAGFASLMASYESRVKSERLLGHFAGAAAKGEIQAPKGTYGYDDADRSKVVPEEAERIREAYSAVDSGLSVGSIVRHWNAEKVPQRKGGTKWTYAHINAILRRARNAGLVSHNGVILEGVEGQWETIVDEELWRRVNAIISDPARKTSPGFQPVYLSSGIAVCAVCGSVMRSNTATDSRRGTRKKILRCSAVKGGERHASADLLLLDSLVKEQLILAFLFGGDALLPRDTGTDVGALLEAQAALSQEKADAMAYRRDGLLNPAEERTRLVEIKERSTLIENQIETARAESSHAHMLIDLRSGLTYKEDGKKRVSIDAAGELGAELTKRFEALHIERQRLLVRQLFEIKVHPGRGEDKYEVTRRSR